MEWATLLQMIHWLILLHHCVLSTISHTTVIVRFRNVKRELEFVQFVEMNILGIWTFWLRRNRWIMTWIRGWRDVSIRCRNTTNVQSSYWNWWIKPANLPTTSTSNCRATSSLEWNATKKPFKDWQVKCVQSQQR